MPALHFDAYMLVLPAQEPSMIEHRKPRRPIDPPQAVGESQRDYPHSSGDRNTKKSESDWKKFEGGTQRDATPAPANSED